MTAIGMTATSLHAYIAWQYGENPYPRPYHMGEYQVPERGVMLVLPRSFMFAAAEADTVT
jgi:hypothetical protein